MTSSAESDSRAPTHLVFPEHELTREGRPHFLVRTYLYRLLRHALGDTASVGSDQFVYWNARDPKKKLAPDVFVRMGTCIRLFGTWKTWENGAPHLAVEIVSPTEDDWLGWDEKLGRYHEAGIDELVRFDPQAPDGKRVRVWDRLDGDLVERAVAEDCTRCRTLGWYWRVTPVEDAPVGLGLTRDAAGRERLYLPEEEERRAKEDAERRVVELEAEIARLRRRP